MSQRGGRAAAGDGGGRKVRMVVPQLTDLDAALGPLD